MTRRGQGRAPHESGTAPDQGPVIDLEDAGSTPIVQQYRAVKAMHPDALVLARLGDFYEMFGADAQEAAPILGVALTGRGFGAAGRLPMCGVPHHAAPGYIRRLLDAGRSVALWDQVGEVVPGRLVQREVTRVLSPGTISEADYLDEARVARCVAVHCTAGRTGIAAFDPASGELLLSEVAGGLDSIALREECERLDVAEVLVADDVDTTAARLLPGVPRSVLPPAFFDSSRARDRLLAVTSADTLEGLGLDGADRAVRAGGAVLAYCERARLTLTPGFVHVRRRSDSAGMRLDTQTRRNLELVAPLGGGVSLAGLLDRTRTPMGGRLLRARLLEPLTEPLLILARHDAVAELVEAPTVRDTLGEALAAVRDLERLVARCVQRSAGPRDLGAVRQACAALPAIQDILFGMRSGEMSAAATRCVAPDELSLRLRTLLVDDPPISARDGGCIRPGADRELDELVAAGADSRAWIASLEDAERARTAIGSLKVGYNRVFGYYIEVPHAQRDAVPAEYTRKQTLVGA
ncbi:MAG TPA: hypothetical protein VLO10_06315, partial [Candidatus Deferrimicrobium sp.]|nr:hypothetical protein [Candidatus Deferrimicrobium sp.]